MDANKDYQLILIDGSSYIYRAFYALPPMKNSKGRPTSVVFGVVNMIRKLVKQYPDSHIAVVFDAPGKNFRHEIYQDYKANRPKMPDEVREQIEPLHRIIKAMGINLLMIKGVEADDVLGTLAYHYAKNTDDQVLISSGDKDLAQLVSAQISVVDTMKNITFDYEQVIKKFGVKPNQIIDYLALVGDSSDNIPGIPKVGAKTAQRWLAQYDSVDEIIKNKDEFKGKIGELLRENIEQLKLSFQLATINTNLSLDKLGNGLAQNLSLKKKERDEKKLIELYREMNFNSWIIEDKEGSSTSLDQYYKNQEIKRNELKEKQYQEKEVQLKNYSPIIETAKQLKGFVTYLQENAKCCCIYWLTKQHNKALKIDKYPSQINPILFQINDGNHQALVSFHKEGLTPEKAIEILKPVLEDETILKLSVQAKFDLHLLNYFDSKITNLKDVPLLAWMLDSNGKHDLKNLALKYLQRDLTEIGGDEKKQFDLSEFGNEQWFEFLKNQTNSILELYKHLSTKLSDRDHALKQLVKLEDKALLSLARMEKNGVLLDKEALFSQGKLLKEKVNQLEKEAYQYAGETFNLASSKQVGEILFDKLKLPIVSKTGAGKPSTAESVLEKLQTKHPIASIILEFRLIKKLITTYIDSLPSKINPHTNRIHTTYNQTGTITGRLSSTEPNLQNIPIRSIEGKKIRQAFIAPQEHFLICADYSQIELRLMADLSGDLAFIKAFNQGQDIHAVTASEVFELAIEKVDSDHRRKAKAVNFGLIYGISAFGLAQQLKIEAKEAKAYIDAYFFRYKKVLEFMENQKQKAKQQGYVQSVMGRRIYLPDINSRNFIQRSHAERMAINAPLQASAADIIKKAMVEIDDWLKEMDFKDKSAPIKMNLQIHDELVFEVHRSYVNQAMQKIRDLMESTFKLKVPLTVNLSKASNLGMIE